VKEALDVNELYQYMTPEEQVEFDKLLTDGLLWVPQPGPQTDAYYSEADILLYGGAAGGGKTDLILGLSLTKHQDSIIFRRESVQLKGIKKRMERIIGSRDGFNGQDLVWKLKTSDGIKRQIDLGHCQHAGDEDKYQGQPHDLIAFDELTHFVESQFRFLMGWNRNAEDPNQRCRVVASTNPPTGEQEDNAEWVKEFWAPWLDPDHNNPAAPGELRWYASIDGQDVPVDSGEPIEHDGELIQPLSRTFIPSKVHDNVFLANSSYVATLQAMPEPLRSKLLHGDFSASRGDNPWQVIPTEWVKAAQARWEDRSPKGTMDSMGVDVARGGKDETIIAARHGMWFDRLDAYPGSDTPDGPSVAALVINKRRDGAPVHVDVIGVGASAYDFLKDNATDIIPVNVAEGTDEKDQAGVLEFGNVRSLLWWRAREALDPANDTGIALPPDDALRAELTAPRWKLVGRKVAIEKKEDLKKRLGRSTDRADAVITALIDTEKENSEPVKLEFARMWT